MSENERDLEYAKKDETWLINLEKLTLYCGSNAIH